MSSHGDPMASMSATDSVSSIETELNLTSTDDDSITASDNDSSTASDNDSIIASESTQLENLVNHAV